MQRWQGGKARESSVKRFATYLKGKGMRNIKDEIIKTNFTLFFSKLNNIFCFVYTKKKTEHMYKANSCSHRAFMRLVPWKSCGIMGVMTPHGGSRRMWGEVTMRSSKVALKDCQTTTSVQVYKVRGQAWSLPYRHRCQRKTWEKSFPKWPVYAL